MLYNNKQIKKPTLEMVQEFIEEKNYNLNAQKIFDHYEKNGWKTVDGNNIKVLESVISAWNSKLKRQKVLSMPYNDQLKTKEWKKFRQRVLDKKGRKCQMCGSTENLCIHHKRYKKDCFAWEYKMKEVKVVCSKCHNIIHQKDDLYKEFMEITK